MEIILGVGAYFILSWYFKDKISDLQILFIDLIFMAICHAIESIGRKYSVIFLPLSCNLNLNRYVCTSSDGTSNITSFTCKLHSDEKISTPFYRIGLSLMPGVKTLYIPLLAEFQTKSNLSKIFFQVTKISMMSRGPLTFRSRKFWRSKAKSVHSQPLQNGEKILMCFALEYDFQDRNAVENGRFLICLKTRCPGSIFFSRSIIEIQSYDSGYMVLSQYHTKFFLLLHIKYFLKVLRLKKELQCVMVTYLYKL